MEAKLGVKSFFMMDENFLLHKRRAHGAARPHEGAREAVGAVRVLFGERDPPVHDAGTGGAGRLVGVDGAGVAALVVPQAGGRRHARSSRAELRRHGIKLLGSTIVGLEHHTPENIEDEIEHAVAHDTDFHQFMLYTPVPGHAAVRRDVAAGADAGRTSTWPTSTASMRSTSSTRRSRARIPSVFSTRRSAATSSATARASTASAAPRWRAGGGIRTMPTRACAPVSRGRPDRCATAMPPRCGRWRSISKAQSHDVARRCGRCARRSGGNSGW